MTCTVFTIGTSKRAHISRNALPGWISSISMKEKQRVLVECFFGLKCLNSKKIAEPEAEQHHHQQLMNETYSC